LAVRIGENAFGAFTAGVDTDVSSYATFMPAVNIFCGIAAYTFSMHPDHRRGR
jgi:hypothetical protein